MNTEKTSTGKMRVYFKAQNIEFSAKRIFIDGLGGSGGPLSVFFVSIVSIFFGKLVSKRTPVDLIVTPAVTILTGVLAAMLIAPPIGKIGTVIGNFIMWATEMRPFVMGLLVSAVMGAVLTLPISSAAICAAFGLTGLRAASLSPYPALS